MPNNDGSQGTTVTLAAADIGQLRSIRYSVDGAPVDLTTLSDTERVYVIGAKDVEVEMVLVGADEDTLEVGDEGAVVITWNDAQVDTLGTLLVTGNEKSGDLDTELTTTVTMKKSITT